MWEDRREPWNAQKDDARGPYDVDFSRIIHSASFRRLQGKTQILNLGDSDFYRTRLTHSLEVAQVGTGIVRQLQRYYLDHPSYSCLPSTSLIQTICLTHDLGHPPFGHGGEVALNFCMRENGGFEANGQTLRILSKLEKFSGAAGANLTRRTLLGVLKYPIPFNRARNPRLVPTLSDHASAFGILDRSISPPKCYHDAEEDIVRWLLQELSDDDMHLFTKMDLPEAGKHGRAAHKSFDCSIMDAADDIAYGIHDLEDMIALGLIKEGDFRSSVMEDDCAAFLDDLKARYPDKFGNDIYNQLVALLFSDGGDRKRQIGRLVHHFLTNVEPYEENGFKAPLLRFRVRIRPGSKKLLAALKRCVFDWVIKNASVQHLEFKGQQMVLAVFEAFSTDPGSLLPMPTFKKYLQENKNTRVICDYIAGMTDHFLLRTYERLFSPRMGSVFDRL